MANVDKAVAIRNLEELVLSAVLLHGSDMSGPALQGLVRASLDNLSLDEIGAVLGRWLLTLARELADALETDARAELFDLVTELGRTIGAETNPVLAELEAAADLEEDDQDEEDDEEDEGDDLDGPCKCAFCAGLDSEDE